jgi:hypothetical protein
MYYQIDTEGALDMKKLITLRISDETQRQIDELMDLWGEQQSETISRCVEREHNRNVREKTKSGRSFASILAEMRVNRTPELERYRDVILYDWPNGDEHWDWVRTASDDELVEWAIQMQAAEPGTRSRDRDLIGPGRTGPAGEAEE